ncbi:hypothetical protein PF004_g30859 [Phytophthora fragariae]|uniref:Tyr recombinase domain-containing protein n=1 Tax=Phytophthora fragariae TaxID=53985 RepID=A0A6G0MAQ2_9STRA|nr:hypothetical protein PF004_g30859 [Phytophthora fragariae]
MASRNHRAQTIIRLLGHWELVFGLRFSAMHVAGADNRIADAGSRAATSGCSESRSDLAFHLRAHSVANSTFSKYRSALKTWFAWSTSRGIQPTLFGYTTDAKIQCITDFILHGFQHGYGSGRPVRGATISAVLHGVLHFFRSAALDFPSGHPQIRMLLKGISRLDAPVRHKAPVSLQLLERCYRTLDLAMPSDQALWGVLCLSFFFLLRQSEIASKGKKFAWFALRAVDIAIFNSAGATTHIAHEATSVHIRLTGSKTNQCGAPTLRMLNRSGYPFLCPVFGALCLLKPRRALPHEIPAAVFINEKGRPDCVTSARVSDILQRVAPSVGGNPAEFSAHSLRAGGATHKYRAGVDALTIQFHGRWASDTFKQYTRLCKESVETLATKIVSGQKLMQRLQ